MLIFADYTIQHQPKIKDADGDEVTLSAFQITRSYINVTGNISRTIAFRVTPDIARETGVGSSLNGSYTFRLKFAFAQWNLDDHLTKGSYARFGMQPTPWLEFIDGVYRYRFQSPTFDDREGFLPDLGCRRRFRYALPGDYGDVVAGFYNGEATPSRKSTIRRASSCAGRCVRSPGVARCTACASPASGTTTPTSRMPIAGAPLAASPSSIRTSTPVRLSGCDRPDVSGERRVESRGWSALVTPITGKGWEGLLRFDHLEARTANTAPAAVPTKDGLSPGWRTGFLTRAACRPR